MAKHSRKYQQALLAAALARRSDLKENPPPLEKVINAFQRELASVQQEATKKAGSAPQAPPSPSPQQQQSHAHPQASPQTAPLPPIPTPTPQTAVPDPKTAWLSLPILGLPQIFALLDARYPKSMLSGQDRKIILDLEKEEAQMVIGIDPIRHPGGSAGLKPRIIAANKVGERRIDLEDRHIMAPLLNTSLLVGEQNLPVDLAVVPAGMLPFPLVIGADLLQAVQLPDTLLMSYEQGAEAARIVYEQADNR